MVNIISLLLLVVISASNSAQAAAKNLAAVESNYLIAANNATLGGTLTLPPIRKSNSLVILISGSGPQDRDETLDGFKVFKQLSTELGEQGIATFRFDDRGVGESTGNFTTTTLADHANDVKAIMQFFKTQDKHKFSEFILFGHSQGGIVGARAAVDNKDVKKIVLMGAPAVPLIDIVLYQIRQEYQGTNIDRALIEAEVSAHNRLMSAIANKQNIKQTLNEFKMSTQNVLSASHQNLALKQVESMAEAKTNEFEIVYALPALTSFLYHDSSNDYAKLAVPVLSLFGGKDLQVTIEQNKDRMENALLKSPSTYQFYTFNNANHYFQKANTGLRAEYAGLDKKFVDDFITSIAQWILTN